MENHAICIPFPAEGHIRPMLKLAQLLHSNFDFHITFVNTHHNHQTFSQSSSSSDNNNSAFNFVSIPEFGSDDPKGIWDVITCFLDKRLESPYRELLSKLCSKDYCLANNLKPVTCMVSDSVMSTITLPVAEETGIPDLVLQTAGASVLMTFVQHKELLDRGIMPFQDPSYLTNGSLEKVIDWIPSMMGIRLKDITSSIRTMDPNCKMVDRVISTTFRSLRSRAMLINTFDALEQDVLKDLSTLSPSIYPIGPLNLLVDQMARNDDKTRLLRRPGAKLRGDLLTISNEEDHEYFKWLDLQEPNSVLYVSFGTSTIMTKEKLMEFAWGFANSHKKFLWVVRCDLVLDGPFSLPLEFEEEIKGRGLLTSWCDQERVLAHPSVGGFLTHCGWNSVIESISNGVPMICWPFVADQVTNSWYCCNRLGVGIELSGEVKRDEVMSVVKELMDEEKGKDMKKKAMGWRELAREATMSPYGSSYVNLKNIVNDVLHSNCIKQ